MVAPGEALPDDIDLEDELLEPEVAAYLGRAPLSLVFGEDKIEIPHPGNFPIFLHAYMLNRFGHRAQNYNIQIQQDLLRDYRVGQFITKAIDSVYELDRASIIDPALLSPLKESEETILTHATVIQEALPYLPPGVSEEIFQDPNRWLDI